jgi:hypothetical protein
MPGTRGVTRTPTSVRTSAGANLRGRNLSGANLSGSGANLEGANLTWAILYGANLSAAKTRANLIGANLAAADLAGADLAEAILFDAILNYANLTDANLTYAYFKHANFTHRLGCGILKRGNLALSEPGTKATPPMPEILGEKGTLGRPRNPAPSNPAAGWDPKQYGANLFGTMGTTARQPRPAHAISPRDERKKSAPLEVLERRAWSRGGDRQAARRAEVMFPFLGTVRFTRRIASSISRARHASRTRGPRCPGASDA